MSDQVKNAVELDQILNATASTEDAPKASPNPVEPNSTLRKVSKFPLAVAILSMLSITGCSTIMNDRITDVSVLSEPAGQRYSIIDEDGQRVRTGTTPDSIKLDAAAGVFDGQTYQVKYEDGKTTELDSRLTGWYWVGFCISVVSGLIVDPLTGDMFSLPSEVSNVSR